MEWTKSLAVAIERSEPMNEKRWESLRLATEAGADVDILLEIASARRVSRKATIVLPAHRFEGLSRGRGWARLGRGNNVTWGEREDGGYRVGPGRWTVGGNDGFSRKGEDTWTVRNLQVGEQTWTVAS